MKHSKRKIENYLSEKGHKVINKGYDGSVCRKIWVNSQSWRIAKVEYYSSESKKEKTLYVSDFIKKNGFSIAGKMVMEKENGNKTVMEVMSYKPDIGLQDEVFTKDYLVKK